MNLQLSSLKKNTFSSFGSSLKPFENNYLNLFPKVNGTGQLQIFEQQINETSKIQKYTE